MKLLAEAKIAAENVNLQELDASYRKATLNMAMVTLSCEQALRHLPEDANKSQVSFVVATHFGEVSSTLEFLSTYHETQTPRPILFQNSLHNSTLGFASLQLGLTGPAMTVSCDRATPHAAMNLAETLLELTPYVLVCFVDHLPAPLVPYYLENFPFVESYLNKARCQLYSRA